MIYKINVISDIRGMTYNKHYINIMNIHEISRFLNDCKIHFTSANNCITLQTLYHKKSIIHIKNIHNDVIILTVSSQSMASTSLLPEEAVALDMSNVWVSWQRFPLEMWSGSDKVLYILSKIVLVSLSRYSLASFSESLKC